MTNYISFHLQMLPVWYWNNITEMGKTAFAEHTHIVFPTCWKRYIIINHGGIIITHKKGYHLINSNRRSVIGLIWAGRCHNPGHPWEHRTVHLNHYWHTPYLTFFSSPPQSKSRWVITIAKDVKRWGKTLMKIPQRFYYVV